MIKLGLIGKDLSYSYSKVIHEYLGDKLGYDVSYDLIEVNSIDEVNYSIYKGLNITNPFKRDILDVLDTLDSSVKKYGSCNTIISNKGYNTDYLGFSYLLSKLGIKEYKRIVIIGSGSTSIMVQEYFKGCEIVVLSRNYDTNNSEIYGDILINTTPIGSGKYINKIPINKELISNFNYVIDLNYNPNKTKILLEADKLFIPNISGIYMLIVQAIRSFEIFLNIKIDDIFIEKVYKYLDKYRYKGECIIGMPFSGKSTYYKNSGYDFIDLDIYIEEQEKVNICDIINKKGIDYFRLIENKYLKEIIDNGTKYIASGGGIILNSNSRELLLEYKIIFLDVDINTLLSRVDYISRPMIKNQDDLINIYNDRYNKYLFFQNERIVKYEDINN